MYDFNKYGTIRTEDNPYTNPMFNISNLNSLNAIGGGIGTGNTNPNNVFKYNVNTGQDPKGNGFMNWLGQGNNLETIAGIGSSLAGLYLGNKQLKMGERALKLQESAFNNNLQHNIQSYNTKLSDQAHARGYTQGQSQADINAHIEKNSLRRI